jgi:hypothetical protein
MLGLLPRSKAVKNRFLQLNHRRLTVKADDFCGAVIGDQRLTVGEALIVHAVSAALADANSERGEEVLWRAG